uniref:Uncharacterized protein n=1 Tax=Arundo donax TaxID=35708 RepID=A0A0A8ZMV3_ARUDO
MLSKLLFLQILMCKGKNFGKRYWCCCFR